jgi:hypothetical protein
MATRTEPTVGETSGALFRALRSVGVEPELAYRADDEVRSQAGQNVIAVVNARFAELSAKIDTQVAELSAKVDTQVAELSAKVDTQVAELSAKVDTQIAELGAKIDAQGTRIDELQRVVWRVIWPLVVLLASTVFGLLYRFLTVPVP